MRKLCFSVAVLFAALAGFVSCNKDNDDVPPIPPVVEDVVGTYAADNLTLKIDNQATTSAEVALVKVNNKLNIRLKNVVPGLAEFTITDATFEAQETKAYVSVISGKDTTFEAGYVVVFAGTINDKEAMDASVTLTKIPTTPVENVAPYQGTYTGKLAVTINDGKPEELDQRVYLGKGSDNAADNSLGKFTIKNFSFMGATLDEILLDNIQLQQRGDVVVINSLAVPVKLADPIGNVLIDIKGTIHNNVMNLTLSIVLPDNDAMKIAVNFNGKISGDAPIEGDVIGRYRGDELALTVNNEANANAEVVLLKKDEKLNIRLMHVIPGQDDFTITDATFEAQEVKAYLSVISGKDTSFVTRYAVAFSGEINDKQSMKASVRLTELPISPVEDVAPYLGTYKGGLVVTLNGQPNPALEQRIYLENGSKNSSNKALGKLTIKNFSFMGATLKEIQLNNIQLQQCSDVVVIDSLAVPVKLADPIGNTLIDIKGTIRNQQMDLTLKIVLPDNDALQIGVGFNGELAVENKTPKIDSLHIKSPFIYIPIKNPVSSVASFTVLESVPAKNQVFTPQVTLAKGCAFDSIGLEVGGIHKTIQATDAIDFSLFTSDQDQVIYYVRAEDPNFTTMYSLKIKRQPVSKRRYTFTAWNGEEPQGWAVTNGAASLIKLFPGLYPKDENNKYKPLPIGPNTDKNKVRVSTLMTTGKLIGPMCIPAVTAGSLFLGNFEINTENTLKSTRFGIPYLETAFPKQVTVKWNYQAGKTYYRTRGEMVDGIFVPEANEDGTLKQIVENAQPDEASVVMVIYEVSDYLTEYLDGTNVKEATNVVAIAAKQLATTPQAVTDVITVTQKQAFDPAKKYKMAIVFSSSAKGDVFEGGEDSQLLVESVELGY